MRRWFPLVLFVTAAAALAGDGTAPPPAAGAATAASIAEQLKALATRCCYEPATFEMDVREPVQFGPTVVMEKLNFPSPVKSSDPARNDVVRAKLFHTATPEPAAVVVFGGWRFDPLTPQLAARLAAETNLQTVFIDLPFQGERTPTGKQPGLVTFSADLAQNEATFVQASQDMGRVLDWLVRERKVDPKRLGILGTSLGGYVACDLYGMTDRFKCGAGLITGGDVASVIFNGNWLTAQIRDGLLAQGLDEKAVRERMKPLDPATWARKERKDGLLLVAAEDDEIVPLDTVKGLAAAYGGARVIVMPKVGHIDAEALPKHFDEVVRHFRDQLVPKAAAAGDPAPAPAPAPTPAPATK